MFILKRVIIGSGKSNSKKGQRTQFCDTPEEIVQFKCKKYNCH